MDAHEAAEQFAAAYSEIYRHFHRRVHHSEYQLTTESISVLRHLAEAGPLTVTECADHMDRSQAAMSEMIDRLAKRGVLSKMPDERDRRRSLVWLTEFGFAKLDEANRVLSTETIASAFADIDPAERTQLVRGLQGLVSNRENEDE